MTVVMVAMKKFTVVAKAFMLIVFVVHVNGVKSSTENINSGKPTTSQPPSVQGWVEFVNQGMTLLPSYMTLEELLGTMSMIPTLDENTFGIILQSLNIDVPNSSELTNLMAVLKNLLKIVSWGSTQLPDGNIGDLVSLISTMDDQNLELLFQSLNVDMLSSTQFADAQRILQDLIASVHDGQSTTANTNTGQSTTFRPPSVQGWAEFLNQAMSILPSSMTLEELLGTMSMIPSLDEQTFAALLQSLNIKVPNSSELSNAMTVLEGLLSIVTWGSSQLPGGNVDDLVNLISNMDENSLQSLLQSLNVDELSSSQFADALAILQDLKKSVSDENVSPPSGDLNDILNMISTMNEQDLQLLLQSVNINIMNPSEISGMLTVLQTLHNLISAGSIQVPNGDIDEFLNMMTSMDVQSLTLLLQNSNINGIDPSQLSDALAVLQSLQSSTSVDNSQKNNSTNSNLINNVDLAELSPDCSAGISFIVSEIVGQNQWALQVIDSWGKPAAGILDGNINWLGSYDQCLSIEPEYQEENTFQLNYCVSGFKYNALNVPILGMCLPKSCTENDVKIITNSVLQQISMDEPLTANYARCKSEIEHDTITIVAICVCSIFLAFMVFATFYDVFILSPKLESTDEPSVTKIEEDTSKTTNDLTFVSVENNESCQEADLESNSKVYHIDTKDSNPKLKNRDGHLESKTPSHHSGLFVKLVLSFSVLTNGRKLLCTKTTRENIGAVTGIRFMTMAWIILGHTYYTNAILSKNMSMLPYYSRIQQRLSIMPVVNGMLSVDTFFVLSGLLVSYYFMKEMKRQKGRINWFMFYFHRLLRITPTYMLVILMDVAFSRYYADGPSWSQTEFTSGYCKDSWWTNLLYVNNFINTDKKCFTWAWFLANDMQFYILSPLLLVPLYFSKKIGAVVVTIFLLGGTIGAAITAAQYPSANTLLIPIPTLDPDTDANNFRKSKDFFNEYFIKPYSHIGPYVLGIVTGYILFKTGGKCRINKPLNVFMWMLSASLSGLVVFGLYEDFRGNPMSSELLILYYAVNKTVWGACICWVVFACATGNGGFVNTLLSWSPFISLSRLTFCAYLVHPSVILAYNLSLRQGVYASDYSVIYMFIGHLIMTLMGAFVTSLAFESPIIGLEKAILRRDKKNK
ncbi:nose resistant to fluoxetine protein 6-like [Pecten maximus]|uniref:nose resistant to fluoxetine protein 6-like n=1 Tax=Pecten maximus TaxID=6579 RepID=UPI001458AAEA|nr:nose resistant to fluoxetine protein 6-like [Pecten maximus]